jgi:hypothetical protein
VKISKDTLKILKNYQKINGSLVVKSGNQIKTVSDAKNIFAVARVDEEFPDFAIYDLNTFLGVVEIFEEPEFEFFDKYLTISAARQETKYKFSDPTVLTVKLPDKEITIVDILVEFLLSSTDITIINQFSSKLSLPDLMIKMENNILVAIVCDKSNSATNCHKIVLEQSKQFSTSDFSLEFKIENLKLLSGDYWVQISKQKISKFENQNLDLVYFVALEYDSTV